MKITADLHIHSHYSRATSKNLNFYHLAKWAQLKGVNLIGTGDIAHPGWLQEMQENLEPTEQGLFQLKEEIAAAVQADVLPACRGAVRFMLAGEISSIYKKGGKTRKVHNVIFAPSLESVGKIQVELERIGNIRSDGRPILGLPSRDLLEIILNVDERCHLIPAHIWTPWFSLLGSKSGYDSVEECFDDLTPHIFALETGLSSDPPMNWRVSGLDGYTLVSNSDAHSPPKLAREATLFDCDLSYDGIFNALKSGEPDQFLGTIEFFPEEGKYHHDGHRKCGVNWKPAVTIAHDGICSVCGKKVTIGVGHRVEELADRPEGVRPASAHPFYSLIPLPEILGELLDVGSTSKRVQQEYQRLLSDLGSELNILLDCPLEEISRAGGETLAAGIARMRRGEVNPIAGYDGEYGIIKIFDTKTVISPQLNLFGDIAAAPVAPTEKAAPSLETLPGTGGERDDIEQTGERLQTAPPILGTASPDLQQSAESLTTNLDSAITHPLLSSLNDRQRQATTCIDSDLIIVAGPGTGKTRTLTTRIAYLLLVEAVPPEAILAITFTNKAAGEMVERLRKLVGAEIADRITIKTFHAFGAMILHEYGASLGLDPYFTILDDDGRSLLLKNTFTDWKKRQLDDSLEAISSAKQRLLSPEADELTTLHDDPRFSDIYQAYEDALKENHCLDFDDLIFKSIRLFETQPDILSAVQQRYRWISVDEYQDINQAQYRLLNLLTAGGSNLCVIGDPDQAIYGFRGADYRYFLSFEQDYPQARRLHLNQNYRSTQMILHAATQVISQNPDRRALEIFSDYLEQVKLEVYRAPTDKAEAEYVVHQIEQMMGGTSYFSLDSGRVDDDTQPVERSFGDFAVLYRLRYQSRLLVEAFERSGIPYQTVGERSFFEESDVQEALAFLWLLYNPMSKVHQQKVKGHDKSKEELRRMQSAGASVFELAETVARFTSMPEALARQFVSRARLYGDDLGGFLEATTLQSETDLYDPRADRVTLMTLHACKGLEFPVVFMIGCEEGLLPYMPQNRYVDVEEERRLFYVGMTRAQQRLILTNALKRFLFGQEMQNASSRFVDDIENALLEMKKMTGTRKKRKGFEAEQLSLF